MPSDAPYSNVRAIFILGNLPMRLFQLFLFALLSIVFSVGNTEEKPRRNQGIVKVIGDFQPLNSAKELPSTILEHLSNEYKDCPGIADPDDEYNSSCAMGSKGLPCKKMLYAGNIGDIWFMEYLQGGAGVSQTFYAFKIINEHVVSILVYQPLSGKQRIVKTEELISSLLNKTPECSKKGDYLQYLAEIHYGLCTSS